MAKEPSVDRALSPLDTLCWKFRRLYVPHTSTLHACMIGRYTHALSCEDGRGNTALSEAAVQGGFGRWSEDRTPGKLWKQGSEHLLLTAAPIHSRFRIMTKRHKCGLESRSSPHSLMQGPRQNGFPVVDA